MSSTPRPPDRGCTIVCLANTAWYLYNFRRTLMQRLVSDGHRVVAIGGDGRYAELLRAAGLEHLDLPVDASGTQPLQELATVRRLRRLLVSVNPDVLLSWTPKGNLYGALALVGLRTAGGTRPRQIMNVSGLGAAAEARGWLGMVVRGLYRIALHRSAWVFFQNEDDRSQFQRAGLVARGGSSRLPGSGVDLERFRPPGPPEEPPIVLMVARLLWDKGVAEFVEAARRLRQQHPSWRFRLLGAVVDGQRGGVPRHRLQAWQAEGLVECLAPVDDVRPALQAARCVVLPSYYREGVPRCLLEAAACARPVVTTDWIGCRDAVDPGVTGLLVAPRDPVSLAEAIAAIVQLGDREWHAMGAAGRAKMEHEFSETRVLDAYREQVERVLSRC